MRLTIKDFRTLAGTVLVIVAIAYIANNLEESGNIFADIVTSFFRIVFEGVKYAIGWMQQNMVVIGER